MTPKEASIVIGNIPIDRNDDCYTIAEYQEAKAMAIKALEQESVLDKIRAEVLKYIDDLDIAYEICGVFDKYDKHKAESED